MLKSAFRSIAYFIAPQAASKVSARWLHPKKARRFLRECERLPSLEAVVKATLRSEAFSPDQKETEALGLLSLLQQQSPTHLCEIGSRRGGSLFLLSRVASPCARMLAIDIGFSEHELRAVPHFRGPAQSITCLQADSHAQGTLRRVQDWLGGHQLDFLFIDGDHSYSGVSADFEMYSPLVRPGGVIAFHDIVPDSKTRRGVGSANDTGEVPAFWAALKQRGYATEELIEDPEQDGMGIGIVHWTGPRAS
jgi:predicted O-methyltransferase YrrM